MQVTGNNLFINKSLSIRISTDGFSFFTPQGRKDFSVGKDSSLSEELDKAIHKLQLLKTDYDEVLLLADYPATRVPLDEFRSEEAQALYLLTFGDDSLQGLSVRYEVLPTLDAVELFPMDVKTEALAKKYFPLVTVHSLCGQTLLKGFVEDRRKEGSQKRLFVSVMGTDLFVFNFVDGHIYFANSYPAAKVSLKIYYTLYVWNQLEMDQENDLCFFYGKDDDFLVSLKKYIRNIKCE